MGTLVLDFPALGSTKTVQADAEAYDVSGSVSAPAAAEVTVYDGPNLDNLVEHVFVGPYSPHTWWGGSGIPLVKKVASGSKLRIVSTGAVSFRIDGPFSLV